MTFPDTPAPGSPESFALPQWIQQERVLTQWQAWRRSVARTAGFAVQLAAASVFSEGLRMTAQGTRIRAPAAYRVHRVKTVLSAWYTRCLVASLPLCLVDSPNLCLLQSEPRQALGPAPSL